MNFQQKMIELKREIRDLKTGHDMRSNMRTFLNSITIPRTITTQVIVTITYADGTQPILTTQITDPGTIPIEQNGNTQEFFVSYVNTGQDTKLWFLSTRKIESIIYTTI